MWNQSLSKLVGCLGLTLVFVSLLGGCFSNGFAGDGGRWGRYAGGGSFIGVRPSISPDGKSIVYSSPRSGSGDIYRLQLDGAQTARLTDHESYEGDPSYCWDGKRIAFIREDKGIAHIWVMNSDGSGQKQLTKGRDYDHGPSFSPDGSKIVYAREIARAPRDLPAEIFVMDSDGGRPTRLTDNNQSDWEASFSPKADAILYSIRSNEIWLMKDDGSKARRLSNHGGTPAFSRDGKRIVFISGQYGREISIMDSDGSNPKPVYRSDTYLSYPTFHPDGQHILFLKRQKQDRGPEVIYMLKLSDGTIQEIASTH